MRIAFLFHHLYMFAQSYLELRSEAPEIDIGHVVHLSGPRPTMNNDSFCQIPVLLPNSNDKVYATVMPEDYEKLTAISEEWHLSSTGYVVSSKRVNGKMKMYYMHREVAGFSPSKHINGDRLDNRKSNLMMALKRPREEYEIYTTLDQTVPPRDAKYAKIDYQQGKIYRGQISDYKPHGFGILNEQLLLKTSVGWWVKGVFESGLVVFYSRNVSQYEDEPPVEYAMLFHNYTKLK